MEFATSKPDYLLFRPDFWLHPKRGLLLLLLFLFGFAIIWALWDVVLPPQTLTDPQFNMPEKANMDWYVYIIYGITGWSFIIMARIIARIEVENDFAFESKKIFLSKNNDIENTRRLSSPITLEIDEIQNTLLLDNKPLYAYKMLEHIIIEGKQRKFEPSLFTTQNFEEKFLDDAGKLNMIQRLALQLGILGTFIGLVQAFSDFKGADMSNANLLNYAINQIINSLGFAFGTSIAGLECAILIIVFATIILEKKHKKLFANLSESATNLINLARNAIIHDEYLAELSQANQRLDQVRTNIKTQSDNLEKQTETIKDGIEKLTTIKSKFDVFIAKVTNDMTNIYTYFSPENLSKDINKNLETTTKRISDQLEGYLSSVLQKYNTLDNSISGIAQGINALKSEIEKDLIASNAVVTESKKEIYENLKQVSDSLKVVSAINLKDEIKNSISTTGRELANSNKEELEKLRVDLTKLQGELETFNHTFQRDLDTRTPIKITLQIFENFGKLIKSIFRSTISLFSK